MMKILFSANPAPIWERVSVSLSGCRPLSRVSLIAEMADFYGRLYHSSALFTADSEGKVYLDTSPSLEGTYTGTDPIGIFWSQVLVKEPEQLLANTDDPLFMRFTAEQDGEKAEVVLERTLISPGVTVEKVRNYGLVAEYYRPAAFGPEKKGLSNIIVFGGSDGGINSGRFLARFLSGHGFGALALAYFGLPELKKDLVRIPLEIIENAIGYVQSRPDSDPEKTGISGISRGGELTLLAASVFPQLHAAAALTPSSILWESEDIFNKAPSFTYRGKDFPWVMCDFSPLYDEIRGRKPFACASVYAEAMKKTEECEKAMIPVERINGPVLMVSGKADLVWPAYEMCLLAEKRFQVHKFPHPYKHVWSEDLGHGVFSSGYLPTNNAYTPSPDITLIRGGKPKENSYGQEKTRKELIEFFRNTAEF
ncbi:MAG: acyl-CoA thioesterase/BAAT N-terminal domain-containing protein [Spirochaetaceae bacterium]|jgi:dienelactone hydrolase|nr:acyl-CoA thioesterase/BAAT N-terminal domain-containing protein [Spirochaetaceae bacterium]